MVKKITMIQTQKKAGRFNIYINDKYAFPVSESVLIKYRLHKGQELDENLIEEIKLADDISKGYNAVLNYLSYQLRTRKEVEDKLRSLDIHEDYIPEIINKLIDLDLINDKNYAESYVRTMMNTSDKGPKVIKLNLLKKGVDDNIAEDALILYTDKLQVEKGVTLAEKLANRYNHDSYRNKQNKIKQSLLTKGFSYDIIDTIIQELDLIFDDDTEREILLEKANKLWSRYDNLDIKKRKFKIQQALFKQGFSFSDITSALDEIEDTNI